VSAQYTNLQQDVNFYRQESAIYEQKNVKLTKKLAKLKQKKSAASSTTETQVSEDDIARETCATEAKDMVPDVGNNQKV
jgi:hypothetical protein